MVDIKNNPTSSTPTLTTEVADSIVTKVLEVGADKAFKDEDSDFDYSHVKIVDKEIDRVVALTRSVAQNGGTKTSVTSEMLSVAPVIDYVLDGDTWTEYKNSFNVEEE